MYRYTDVCVCVFVYTHSILCTTDGGRQTVTVRLLYRQTPQTRGRDDDDDDDDCDTHSSYTHNIIRTPPSYHVLLFRVRARGSSVRKTK